MIGVALSLILFVMGAPHLDGAQNTRVVFEAGSPMGEDIRGIACGPSLIWPGDEPNPICHGYPDGTVILWAASIETYPDRFGWDFRYWLLDTLAHEHCHEVNGLDLDAEPGWDGGREAECYAAGRRYALQDRWKGAK